MNIHHTSKHYCLFEPNLHLDGKLLHLHNVMEAFQLQIPEEETELLKALVKLIAFAKIISKEDSLPLSAAHVLVSCVYTVKKGYWKQGEYHASEGILHAENVPTCRQQLDILSEAYYLLGYNRQKQGKTGESLEAVTAAKNCVEELKYIGYSPCDAELPYKIAVLSAWSSPSKLPLLQEAIEHKGPPEKNVYVYLMISNFHQANGDTAEALKTSRQAVEAANQFDDLAMQADANRCLATCYLESPGHGCPEEGLATLRQTVALYTSHFSGLHPATLSTTDLVIAALIKQDKHDEAVEELKAVKEAKILKYGEFSKEMADYHKQLGSLYLIQNREKQALSTFKSCLAILNVIQTKPNNVTASMKDIIKSLEANKTDRPMFKLYSKVNE